MTFCHATWCEEPSSGLHLSESPDFMSQEKREAASAPTGASRGSSPELRDSPSLRSSTWLPAVGSGVSGAAGVVAAVGTGLGSAANVGTEVGEGVGAAVAVVQTFESAEHIWPATHVVLPHAHG